MRRRLLVLLLLPVVLGAACGGGSSRVPELADARSKTVAERTAAFTLLIDAVVGGRPIRSSETGTVSFADRRAHLYKLEPGGGLGKELIVDGPFLYANANVQAAMADSRVKPWTRLDTRRLSARQRQTRPDELAHVRALVYLADGVAAAKRLGVETVEGARTTRFRGTVDPARVVAEAPPRLRPDLAKAVRNDFRDRPFSADFWLDDAGRVSRVLVAYRTAGGTPITVDGRFADFGTGVDLTLPPPESVQDVSP